MPTVTVFESKIIRGPSKFDLSVALFANPFAYPHSTVVFRLSDKTEVTVTIDSVSRIYDNIWRLKGWVKTGEYKDKAYTANFRTHERTGTLKVL